MTAPGDPIDVPDLPNLRDVGGWRTRDKRTVRRGLLYRSVAPARLDPAGVVALGALDIRTVFDLRTAAERQARPDRLPAGAEQVALDVLADASNAAPAQLDGILDDPTRAVAVLGDGGAQQIFTEAYRDIVRLPSAQHAYRTLLTQLADGGRRPALVHCTTGKDRTGWASAVLLRLLGVPEHLVLREYLLTNAQLLPALQPVLDAFRAKGGEPDVLIPILGVHPSYLQAAFDEAETQYGSFTGYLRDGLGLGESDLAALRETFVEG